ncbi:MAG: hypothetical protein ACLQIB_24570 [Isosphaeraceae bacterium]
MLARNQEAELRRHNPAFGIMVNFEGNLTSLGSTLDITDGTANLGSNSLDLEVFDFIDGTLTGTGTLTVTEGVIWNHSTMAGTGQTIAAGYVDINYGILDSCSFTNDGGCAVFGALTFDNSAGFTSAGPGTFNAISGASLVQGDGSPPFFNNGGTFNVQINADTTFTDNGVAFNNTGTVKVWSGTLSLSDMTLANNSVINQSGSSTLQVESGATLYNTVAGTYAWSGGTLDVTNGTVTNAGAINWSGGTLDVTSGTLSSAGTIDVSGSTDTAISNFVGTLTNTADFEQTGGVFSAGSGGAFTNGVTGTYT